tara:strand:+ start:6857 stop:6997 length:141 start_codon:yes stop_codon:yes gene_type:complete
MASHIECETKYMTVSGKNKRILKKHVNEKTKMERQLVVEPKDGGGL